MIIDTLIKADEINHNGRKYTREALEKAIAEAPDALTICFDNDPNKPVGVAKDLKLNEEGVLSADLTITDDMIKTLFDVGASVSVAPFGTGIFDANTKEVRDYKMTGIGVFPFPSETNK